MSGLCLFLFFFINFFFFGRLMQLLLVSYSSWSSFPSFFSTFFGFFFFFGNLASKLRVRVCACVWYSCAFYTIKGHATRERALCVAHLNGWGIKGPFFASPQISSWEIIIYFLALIVFQLLDILSI